MDNNEFLSYFWNLTDQTPEQEIIKASESITNAVESKQKFGNDPHKEVNTFKYKLYLNICDNPSEDILYTFHRIVNFFN
jgi:hypothetical protein